MQQLSGLDASFLYLETANVPMHISGLAIYDQSTAPGGKVRFKTIIEHTARKIARVTNLSRRLATVPMGVDHPYWVTDGSFDPEFHIRHIALPKPGDWRQLCILISRIHARPLDRSRPLWELYVIEGLDNVKGYPKGSFAMFTKMHHAAVDGASGMEITAAVNDLTPHVDPNAEEKPPIIEVDREVGSIELLARAQYNAIRQPFRFLSVARNTVPGFAKLYSGLRKGELKRVSEIPKTRFNHTVSPHRVFDAIEFSLDEIKAIKNAVPGVTVNDVALTIVGGALRRYLDDKGELPEKSLAAMAPVNVRTDKERGSGGNIVSAMTVELRSDIEDPAERLSAVHESTGQAKEFNNAVGARVMTDYTQFVPGSLAALSARLASSWGLTNQMKPLYNCVITNVPGPQIPLYSSGAKMVSNFGTGPVFDGVGLFHVVSSYCGTFTISATACRLMMPDPEFYRQCLQDSFDALRAATVKPEKPVRIKKKARASLKVAAKSKAKPKAAAKEAAVNAG